MDKQGEKQIKKPTHSVFLSIFYFVSFNIVYYLLWYAAANFWFSDSGLDGVGMALIFLFSGIILLNILLSLFFSKKHNGRQLLVVILVSIIIIVIIWVFTA